jgi:HAMP domain-containing protein
MKIKNKLLATIIVLALIPVISTSLVFYIIGTNTLREQLKTAHNEAVLAVDTLIFTVISDMTNIAFTATPEIADIIERNDYEELRRKLNTIDQINAPDVGTGRGLGYQVVIATDRQGNILARSNITRISGQSVEMNVSQRGHILYLDENKQERWNAPKNFVIAINNVLNGEPDARKIIYDANFLRREGYERLVQQYNFQEMMGLTAMRPILNQNNEQIGALILITILNNNHTVTNIINSVTGAEFTAITPDGEIMTSFFVNPPILSQEIINLAQDRVNQITQGIKKPTGLDTIFYTKERVKLKTCPGNIIFKGNNVGLCYVNETHIPFEELEERAYRLHFISEVDQDFNNVSIRGIAYDLTDNDALINTQARYFAMVFSVTFLIILLMSLLAAKRVTRPILKLTEEIKKIEKDGFGNKIKIKTGDEIESLVDSFNSMSEKIAENYERMKEQKDVLEIKVRAKTKELRDLAGSLDEEVKEKTKELQERVVELERFHRLTVGRELKMVELKEELEKVKEELEKYKKA